MTNKDNIDRTLGVDCTIVVDGKKYSTTVYPTHEKLPEGGAMSWSTDFSKLPKEGRVIVQCKPARQREDFKDPSYIYDVNTIRNTLEYCLAWHPTPEPFLPPKPEQISSEEADKYIVEESSNRVLNWSPETLSWVPGKTQKLIKAVEQRTREIVEWEQKYGGEE